MMNSGNYLSHHGIDGQKWGQRNGPPYPLNPQDYSSAEKTAARTGESKSASVVKRRLAQAAKAVQARSEKRKAEKAAEEEAKKVLEEEEKKITKTKVINSGDPKLIYEYRSYLDNKEFQEALVRVNNEKKLKELNDEATKKGKRWIEKALVEEGKALGTKATKAIVDYAASEALKKVVEMDPTGKVGDIYKFSNSQKK